jgi:tetratricopeptide (TPR) repeat protein
MNQAIYNAEIALGIRKPPPDQRALAESTRLSLSAYGIVARNETAQFEIALAQVNEALRLNPDNRQAMEIKTRLQDVGGSTVVSVLPSAAEEQFRAAQQLFSSQNYFEALAIVERLLQTPAGRSYPPLLELRRRIESQI